MILECLYNATIRDSEDLQCLKIKVYYESHYIDELVFLEVDLTYC